jgi:mannose/fructose/N-acetylgalactosamine-specific phosphotransferase system component IIB
MIIANNSIAQNEWEKNLLLMAAPPNIDARVLTIDEALVYIHENLESKEISMVLVNSPQDIQQMADKGLKVKRINVGGIHFNEGRAEYLSYLYLDREEVEIFKKLIQEGFFFECQDVPISAKYDLTKILEKKS